MTIFQQRILCHRLPQSFNQNERITDHTAHNINLQNKSLQEEKRRQLDRTLESYETKLLDYENHYETEYSYLEIQLWREYYSEARDYYDRIVESLQVYLTHRQSRTLRTIRFGEKYVRSVLRQLQRRRTSRKTKHKKKKNNNNDTNKRMINVYPQVIIDTTKVCLNQRQLDYLSQRGK